jgi:hypothetical protein
MKGRFDLAIMSPDEIPWKVNTEGETYVRIRAVSHTYLHIKKKS